MRYRVYLLVRVCVCVCTCVRTRAHKHKVIIPVCGSCGLELVQGATLQAVLMGTRKRNVWQLGRGHVGQLVYLRGHS